MVEYPRLPAYHYYASLPKIFLCLVYSDDTWKIYYTPDEEFGGWVGFEGGRDKAKNVADEICKNRDAFVRS